MFVAENTERYACDEVLSMHLFCLSKKIQFVVVVVVAQNQFRLRLRGLHIGRTLSGGAQASSIYQRSAQSLLLQRVAFPLLIRIRNKRSHIGTRPVKSPSITSVEGRRVWLSHILH